MTPENSTQNTPQNVVASVRAHENARLPADAYDARPAASRARDADPVVAPSDRGVRE